MSARDSFRLSIYVFGFAMMGVYLGYSKGLSTAVFYGANGIWIGWLVGCVTIITQRVCEWDKRAK
jgi:hypothetical protein